MSMIDRIYLDNNATTKTDPAVLQSMIPFFTDYPANPGSPHLEGISAKETVDDAIWQVANMISAKEHEIIITSGATEAINLAIKGLKKHSSRKKIITFTTEHKAVLDTCQYMESEGFEVEYLPVLPDGIIDFNRFEKALTEDTLLVIAMMVNNETGTIQNIKTVSKVTHAKGAFLFCDTTQAIGKIEINADDLGIDLLSISAHKFYGPKGVGALYVSQKSKIKLSGEIHGGGQQKNLRSGTLNVPGIIGLGKAAELSKSLMHEEKNLIGKLRDQLENALLNIDGTYVNGSTTSRIYNTTNICFPGVISENLILALGPISVSSGSACSSVTSEPSHVLKALGISDEDALSSIRFSLGRFTTAEEIDCTVKKVTELVHQLRS